MSKNITIQGASYSDVPAVTLPQTGGGTASFFDVSDTTAAAADVASGKYFYTAGGVLTPGTASGGGGSNWTLLATQDFAVSTTSTSNTSVGYISGLDYDVYANKNTVLWVHIRDKAGKREGYFYGSDAIFLHYGLANGSTSALSTRPLVVFRYTSSGYAVSTSTYGVYAYRVYYTSGNNQVQIYRRYNSSNSLTIDGTYQCDVYALTLPSGMTLFT